MIIITVPGRSRGSPRSPIPDFDPGDPDLHRAVHRLPRLEPARQMGRANVLLVDGRAPRTLRRTAIM